MPLILLSNNNGVSAKVETPVQVKTEVPVRKPVSDVVGADAKGHHVLLVNGKQKKIGNKSTYLLDMLTLDDE